jgi:hypothetical protein
VGRAPCDACSAHACCGCCCCCGGGGVLGSNHAACCQHGWVQRTFNQVLQTGCPAGCTGLPLLACTCIRQQQRPLWHTQQQQQHT